MEELVTVVWSCYQCLLHLYDAVTYYFIITIFYFVNDLFDFLIGMLHFEIYNGRQNANAVWYPPSGQRSAGMTNNNNNNSLMNFE